MWLFYKWNRCTDVFKKERNTAVLREVRHKRKERPTKRGWASIIWWCHPCLWHSCFKNQHPLSDIVRLWNLRSIYIYTSRFHRLNLNWNLGLKKILQKLFNWILSWHWLHHIAYNIYIITKNRYTENL